MPFILWKHVRKAVAYRYMKFIRYQPGGETFSFFCDSVELLEILNFLPDKQDLGTLPSAVNNFEPQKVPATAAA